MKVEVQITTTKTIEIDDGDQRFCSIFCSKNPQVWGAGDVTYSCHVYKEQLVDLKHGDNNPFHKFYRCPACIAAAPLPHGVSSPHDDRAFRQACDLWERYYEATEEYDRTVCTGLEGKDGIMPANYTERMLIEKNALAIRDKVHESARVLDIPADILEKARIRIGFNTARPRQSTIKKISCGTGEPPANAPELIILDEADPVPEKET